MINVFLCFNKYKYYAAKKLNNKTIYYEIIDYAAKKLNNKTIINY